MENDWSQAIRESVSSNLTIANWLETSLTVMQ